MTVKVCIAGTGRMGQALVENCPADFEIIGTIGGEGLLGLSSLNTIPTNADLVIDFSHPSLTMSLLDKFSSDKTALLVATTGFNEDEFAKLKSLTRPVLYAPNTSTGIFAFRKILQGFTQHFKDWQIAIHETHHIHKKDKPSGTAKTLAECVNFPIEDITADRVGEVFGEHEVTFSTPHESFTLSHKANDRGLFAVGAYRFAKWLNSQNPGFYTLDAVNL